MNLVLIGYRGTGKSVVGALLSGRLGMPCISMDETIVERAGMSIPKIVEKHDWETFRDMESDVARDLAGQEGIIIDTGGGVIERQENVAILNADSLVVWLKASVDVIVSRIEGGTDRPSLTDGKSFTDEVEEVLERRIPKYRSACRHEIDTDRLTPGQIADRIADIWRQSL